MTTDELKQLLADCVSSDSDQKALQDAKKVIGVFVAEVSRRAEEDPTKTYQTAKCAAMRAIVDELSK